MDNELKDIKPKEAEPKKNSKLGQSVIDVLDGSFLTKENVVKQIPFVVFIVVLSAFYISNTFKAEHTFKEIRETENDLKELRSEYISTAALLMFTSKQSEVAAQVDTLNIKESIVPPKIIFINNNQFQKIY